MERTKIHFLHESGFGILMGFAIGFILKMLGKEIAFSGDSFFFIILPPIIFAPGYNMKK